MIMQILDHLPGFTRWGLYGISSDWKGDGDRARQGHTGRGLCWPEVFLRGGNRSPAGAALRPHRLSAPRAPGNAAALAPRAARALRPAAPNSSSERSRAGESAPAAAAGSAAGAPLKGHGHATAFLPGAGRAGRAAVRSLSPGTPRAEAGGGGGRRRRREGAAAVRPRRAGEAAAGCVAMTALP